MYHSIGEAPSGARDPFLYVSKGRFEEQLAMLAGRGFVPGSLDDLAGHEKNTDRKVVITFDDGYRNVLKNGLEALVKHRFKAVQYIVAGMIGTRNEWDVKHGNVPEALMDAGEIREWLAAGQEIGSHSLTHANLATATGAGGARANHGQQKETGRHFRGRSAAFRVSGREMVADVAGPRARGGICNRMHDRVWGEHSADAEV